MRSIAVIGSINMDVVLRSDRMPKQGESLIAAGAEYFPGGKGANQAVAVKRLGGEVRMVGRVGCDGFGKDLRHALESAEVNTSLVIDDPTERTGLAVITVLDGGGNSILVAPGANMKVCPDDIDLLFSSGSWPEIVLLQFEIPIEVDACVIERCKRESSFVILDAGPARNCPVEIVRGVDIITPNETEAEAITGVKVDSLQSAKLAAGALLDMGAQCVVLKMGHRGSLLAHSSEMRHFPAFNVKAVDSTAAGDVFTGALAVKLYEGAGMDESIEFANAAGALAATKMGAQSSIPYRSDVEKFLSGTSSRNTL